MSIALKRRIVIAALAVVVAITTTRACVAQSVAARATVTLPAVAVVRSVSTIARRRISDFVLLEAGARVLVAKGGVRGAESTTTVILRIEASGVGIDAALPRVAYYAVADAS